MGGLQRTDKPSCSLVGRGSGPLLAPSASAAACAIRLCQPSAAEASGLGSQAEPAPAQLGVGLGCCAGSRKGSTALFYFSKAPLCPQSPDLSQPWGPDSARCQSLAVSSVPTSLPPPARGLLPAPGSGSIRPCQPQLLHSSFPTPWLKAGSPSIWRGWLSAPAAPDPGSPPQLPPPTPSPVTRVLFPPLCLLLAQDSLLPSRPWLEAHNERASPTDWEVENHHGNQASLSSLPSPSSPGFPEGARGLMGSSCSQGHRRVREGQEDWSSQWDIY